MARRLRRPTYAAAILVKPLFALRLRELLTLDRLSSASSVLVATNIAISVLRLCSTLLLTRLLSPRDFGMIAIISSIFFVIAMITDAGFEAYIVRHERGEEPNFLDTIWSLHLARGLLNAAVAMTLALPLAYALHKPGLAPLLAVAGMSLLIDGAASLTLLTALRTGLVKRLSLIDFVAQVCQFLIGVLFAWLLRSAWALVISILSYSLIRTAASYALFPAAVRKLRFDRTLAAELWHFSRVIAASSILTLVIAQVDKLLLARVLPLEVFGVYAIASNLAAAPVAIAGQYMSRIFYPAVAFSWRKEPGSIAQRYYSLRGPVMLTYLAGGGIMIGAAPFIIRTLYDQRYWGAGLYLRLLAISTTLIMLTRSANEALVAIGKTGTTLTANLVRLMWLLPVGLTAFAVFGPLGLIVTVSLTELPAYAYTGYVLRRLGIFHVRRESFAMLVIGSGIFVGLVLDELASLIRHM